MSETLILLEENLHALIGHVAVQLCDRLIRRVHGQDRNTCVKRVDVALGHILCNRSAAACVGLAEFGHLPHDAVAVEQLANAAHDLGRRIGCAALAAGAGVLAKTHAVVDIGRVAALVDLGEVGVLSGGDIGGDAEGVR